MLLHLVGQLALQRINHPQQIGARQPCFHPLLHQLQADGLRPQDVRAVHVLPLQHLGALAQGVELLADLLGHREGHARGDDLVFHHIVAEQLEGEIHRAATRASAGGGQYRITPRLGGAVKPCGLVLLVQQPGIAAGLHFSLGARLRHQRRQELTHRFVQVRQAGAQTLDETLPCLARKAALRYERFRGLHASILPAQTAAPALGSFGSPPSLRGADTRSSRLTPSHMAMAAATNTEE